MAIRNNLYNKKKKHQNNLFDWIIEKNLTYYKHSFSQIAFESAEQENAHTLIDIKDIKKNITFHSNFKN